MQVPLVPGFQCGLSAHFPFLVSLWPWGDSSPSPSLPSWVSSRGVKSRRWGRSPSSRQDFGFGIAGVVPVLASPRLLSARSPGTSLSTLGYLPCHLNTSCDLYFQSPPKPRRSSVKHKFTNPRLPGACSVCWARRRRWAGSRGFGQAPTGRATLCPSPATSSPAGTAWAAGLRVFGSGLGLGTAGDGCLGSRRTHQRSQLKPRQKQLQVGSGDGGSGSGTPPG